MCACNSTLGIAAISSFNVMMFERLKIHSFLLVIVQIKNCESTNCESTNRESKNCESTNHQATNCTSQEISFQKSRIYPAYIDLLQHGYFQRASQLFQNHNFTNLERRGRKIIRYKCPKWTTLHGCIKSRKDQTSECKNVCRLHSCGILPESSNFEPDVCYSSILGGISGSRCLRKCKKNSSKIKFICACKKHASSDHQEDDLDDSLCAWQKLDGTC